MTTDERLAATAYLSDVMSEVSDMLTGMYVLHTLEDTQYNQETLSFLLTEAQNVETFLATGETDE